MISMTEETRPIVADAPFFKWSSNDNVRLLYRMPVDFADWIEVVGDPSGGYEWLRRDRDGKVIAHSDCGYGSTEVCMRDGLAAASAEPSVQDTREMENILRKLVQADQRCGLLEGLRAKVALQNDECDDGDAWMISALDSARKMVMKLNRASELASIKT